MEKVQSLLAQVQERLSLPELPQIGRREIAVLVAAALAAIAAVLGFPGQLSSTMAFLPQGWLFVVSVALVAAVFWGAKRAFLGTALLCFVLAPLAQPVSTPLCAVLFTAVAVYLSSRKGWLNKKSAIPLILGAMVLYDLCVIGLALLVVPALAVVAAWAWGLLPTTVALFAASGITALYVRRRRRKLKQLQEQGASKAEAGVPRKLVNFAWRFGWLGLLWGLVPFSYWANNNASVVQLQMRHGMLIEDLTDWPQTRETRVLPRATAETYIQSLNRGYLQQTQDPHLQLRPDGKLWWQSPLHDKTIWGRILGGVSKLVAVDADRVDQHAEDAADGRFIFGDESWVVEGVLKFRHPTAIATEVNYYLNADGSWSCLVSYTSKKPSWTMPAPLTMIECYAGVMEVTQNGLVFDYTPQQAAQRYPGAVLYPAALLRKQAEAYAKWRHGFSGTKIAQFEVLEVSEDTSPDALLNRQPYVQDFEGLGLQLVVSLEPLGDSQYALVELILADAGSGKLRRFVVPPGYIGPRQARLNVRSSDTRVDWSHIRKVEPRIVIGPRGKFWLIAIVSHWENEADRHPYVTSVLVDAFTATDCYTFQSAKELKEFLKQPRPAVDAAAPATPKLP